MHQKYRSTMLACFTGYWVQAITVTYVPLLFVTFQKSYGISLSKITLLVTFNFLLQLVIDAASVKFVDRIGFRPIAVAANLFAAVGLALLTILPDVMPDPYTGLLIAMAVYATGSGLLEVIISPIVEACPSDSKSRAMSLLHSFYCWGYMAAVLVSTVFFAVFGLENWRIMTLIWAIVPVVDCIAFTRVPIASLLKEGEKGMPLKELLGKKVFWLMLLAMVCSGASEQTVSQWASVLAEQGLGVSKTIGDLMGPMFFALAMGLSRIIYSKTESGFPLEKFMLGSCLLCLASYLIISLSPWPIVSLLGCGLCGFSVGIFWPGTLSLASRTLRRGGPALFSLLALGGDLGCSAGPTVAGMVSDAFSGDLKIGILVAIAFPAVLLLCLRMQRRAVKAG